MMQELTGVAGASVSSMCQSPSASCSLMRRTQLTSTNTLSSRPTRRAHPSLLVKLKGAQPVRISRISTGVGERGCDGNVYIFESDLRVSVKDWEVQNGVMEIRIVKWCLDDVSHGCVLGMDLTADLAQRLVTKGLEYAYDEDHLGYPVGELFGTLWAIITHRMARRNIFDDKHAVQCATFVRMCYQAIGRDPVTGPVAISNTSP